MFDLIFSHERTHGPKKSIEVLTMNIQFRFTTKQKIFFLTEKFVQLVTTNIFIKNIALFFITVGWLIFHKDSLSIKTVVIFISKHVLQFLVIDLSIEKCDWFFFPIQTKPKTYLLQFYFLRFYTCFLILTSSLLYWDRPKNFKLRKRSQKKALVMDRVVLETWVLGFEIAIEKWGYFLPNHWHIGWFFSKWRALMFTAKILH